MIKKVLRRSILFVAIGLMFTMPAEPVAAKEFEIILLLKPEKKQDETITLVIVAGGYLDGLKEGAVGSLQRKFPAGLARSSSEPLEVEVQVADPYGSTCSIRGAGFGEIRPGLKVSFNFPKLGVQEFRDLANEALALKKYRRAMLYFERLIDVEGEDTDRSSHELLALCRDEIGQVNDREPSKQERKAEKKRAEVNYQVGVYFFNQRNEDAAQHYFERAVRADKKQKHADYLLGVIEDNSLPSHVPDSVGHAGLGLYPEMIYNQSPDYPNKERRAGVTGVVWIKALVDTSGVVLKVLVDQTSGSMALDKAAIKAALLNRFKPAVRDDKPIFCWVKYRVDFVLDR